ncbi:MAG TPA: DUF2061 domain-containing protein [Azospirillum sp.]
MPRALLFLLAAVLFGSAPAAAAGLERFTGHVALSGKQIPLPAGEWLLAGRGGAEPFDSAVLVQLAGRDVRAFIIATTNAATTNAATTNAKETSAGWGLTRDCSRPDVQFAAIRYASAVDGACRFVNRVTTNVRPGSSPAWIAAVDTAAREGWTLPSLWLMAGVRVTDRRDVVDIRYHFLGSLPDTAATWTEQALERAERGLRGRLDGDDPLAMPDLSAAPAPYRVSPPMLAGDVAGDSGGTGPWGLGVMKTLSWRIVGTAADVAVAFLFTGDPVLSGGLAATGAVVNSILYFGHEMAWNRTADTAPALLEFPGAGAPADE